VNSGGVGFISADQSSQSLAFTTVGTERLRIDSSGNVGIGTTNPSVKFHVAGASIISNNTAIDPDNYASQTVAGAIGDGSGWGLTSAIGGNAGTGDSWAIGHNGNGLFMGMQNGSAADTMQTYIQFETNRNLLLVPTSGNVGIGTTSPDVKTEIWGVAQASATTSADNGILNICSTNGVQLQFVSLANSPYGFALQTKDNNNAGPYNYPIILQPSNGNVGIGTTNPGSYKLQVQGDQYISGTLTEASSITLKENVDQITNALDYVSKLVGVTYDRKDGSAKHRAGLIAEEVVQVLPNVVNKDLEGNASGIQYTNLIAYLIESIKELKAEIDVLKSK